MKCPCYGCVNVECYAFRINARWLEDGEGPFSRAPYKDPDSEWIDGFATPPWNERYNRKEASK